MRKSLSGRRTCNTASILGGGGDSSPGLGAPERDEIAHSPLRTRATLRISQLSEANVRRGRKSTYGTPVRSSTTGVSLEMPRRQLGKFTVLRDVPSPRHSCIMADQHNNLTKVPWSCLNCNKHVGTRWRLNQVRDWYKVLETQRRTMVVSMTERCTTVRQVQPGPRRITRVEENRTTSQRDSVRKSRCELHHSSRLCSIES